MEWHILSTQMMRLQENKQRFCKVSYQHHLEDHQFKRQHPAQLEEFKANSRPGLNNYQLDVDYAYSVAQNNIPRHHRPAYNHR